MHLQCSWPRQHPTCEWVGIAPKTFLQSSLKVYNSRNSLRTCECLWTATVPAPSSPHLPPHNPCNQQHCIGVTLQWCVGFSHHWARQGTNNRNCKQILTWAGRDISSSAGINQMHSDKQNGNFYSRTLPSENLLQQPNSQVYHLTTPHTHFMSAEPPVPLLSDQYTWKRIFGIDRRWQVWSLYTSIVHPCPVATSPQIWGYAVLQSTILQAWLCLSMHVHVGTTGGNWTTPLHDCCWKGGQRHDSTQAEHKSMTTQRTNNSNSWLWFEYRLWQARSSHQIMIDTMLLNDELQWRMLHLQMQSCHPGYIMRWVLVKQLLTRRWIKCHSHNDVDKQGFETVYMLGTLVQTHWTWMEWKRAQRDYAKAS